MAPFLPSNPHVNRTIVRCSIHTCSTPPPRYRLRIYVCMYAYVHTMEMETFYWTLSSVVCNHFAWIWKMECRSATRYTSARAASVKRESEEEAARNRAILWRAVRFFHFERIVSVACVVSRLLLCFVFAFSISFLFRW